MQITPDDIKNLKRMIGANKYFKDAKEDVESIARLEEAGLLVRSIFPWISRGCFFVTRKGCELAGLNKKTNQWSWPAPKS